MIARWILCLTAFLVFSSPHNLGAQDKQGFVFEGWMLRIDQPLSGHTSAEESMWGGPAPPSPEQKRALTWFTEASFELGENHLEVHDGVWTWNGEPFLSPEDLKTGASDCVQMVQLPGITLVEGIHNSFEIESNQRLEYFEHKEGDLYELKRLDEPTGLRLSIMAESTGPETIHIPQIKVSMRVVEDRQPLPGCSLRVGLPILSSREYSADLNVTEDEPFGLILNPGRGQSLLMVRIRLSRAKPINPPAPKDEKP